MVQNVGTADSIIRVWAGIAIVAAASFIPVSLNWVALLGVILVVTAILRFCPIYLPFHIHT
jgi:hypothetical protein